MRFRADENPLPYLRRLMGDLDVLTEQMLRDRDGVYRRYGAMFDPARLGQLEAQDFASFLSFGNNRHWWGIHRHKGRLTEDMGRLRAGLAILLDEERPIVDRLNWLWPSGGFRPVPGLGRAVATPILHVVYPSGYGVENTIAEAAMQRLGLWPWMPRGSTRGDRYLLVNSELGRIAQQLGVDLWTVDSLWWRVERENDPSHHQWDPLTGQNARAPGPTRPVKPVKPRTFVCRRCHLQKPLAQRAAPDRDECRDCAAG